MTGNLSFEQQLDDLLKQATDLCNKGALADAARLLDRAPDIVKNFGTWRYARGSIAF